LIAEHASSVWAVLARRPAWEQRDSVGHGMSRESFIPRCGNDWGLLSALAQEFEVSNGAAAAIIGHHTAVPFCAFALWALDPYSFR